MDITLLIFCICYYLLGAVVIVIGYHRTLSHRSLTLAPWFERPLVLLGLPAGTPVQWVGNHRHHHAHTDVEGDPHSPHLDGFWYAHNGWYIGTRNPLICFLYALAGPLRFLYDAWNRPRTNQQFNHLASDVSRVPFYALISRPLPYLILMLLHIAVPFGFVYAFWGITGVLMLWFTLALMFNIGDAIDSFSHMIGEQPYSMLNKARNGWLMAILTIGDGWHADHHQFPGSARLGFKQGRIDIAWQIILVLKWLGIATDVHECSHEQVLQKLKNTAI